MHFPVHSYKIQMNLELKYEDELRLLRKSLEDSQKEMIKLKEEYLRLSYIVKAARRRRAWRGRGRSRAGEAWPLLCYC